MLKLLGTWLGVLVSVVGLFFTLAPKDYNFSLIQLIFMIIFAVILILLIFYDFKGYWIKRPKKFKNSSGINRYMYKWISNDGRVVIFTRDMSWAGDEKIKELLQNKAGKDELIICLPESIDLSNELKDLGAKIITYKDLEYIPLSRFTIIHSGTDYATVAVGRSIRGKHTIEEFSLGEHPVFTVANDLVSMLDKYSSKMA